MAGKRQSKLLRGFSKVMMHPPKNAAIMQRAVTSANRFPINVLARRLGLEKSAAQPYISATVLYATDGAVEKVVQQVPRCRARQTF